MPNLRDTRPSNGFSEMRRVRPAAADLAILQALPSTSPYPLKVMRFVIVLICTLASAVPVLATAQPSVQDPDRSFSRGWPSLCRTLAVNAVSALSGPELQPILESHPIQIDEVCRCIERRMKADQYLAVLFVESNAEALKSRESNAWRLYIRGKAAAFVAACVASELERFASAIYPGTADNLSIDSDPRLKEAASPQVLRSGGLQR